MIFDAIIVGGGPAGLNAALVLGRCRRNVLLFDTGKQRNRFSHGIHNYLTRDNILPGDFLTIAYKEIKRYGAAVNRVEIVHAGKLQSGIFFVKDKQGKKFYSKKLLLATGLTDNIPPVEGIMDFYGSSIFHCPYCDGWEVSNKRIGVYAKNKNGFELAISLLTWSDKITLYTDGKNYLKPLEKEALQRKKIRVVGDKILKLEGTKGQLENVLLLNNKKQKCEAMFFSNGYRQQCDIVQALGCEMNKKGVVITNRLQQANIPGLYVAGDVAKDMHFVVVAAAEGAKAGVSINKELQKEEFRK
jgi:thioredoxin reductase